MKQIAKQSILTTLSSYLGVLIGYFNVLWLLPYALQPEQIGIFRTIQDMGLLFVPFAQLGVGNGITRFYPKVKENQFSFFTLSLVIAIIGFVVVMAIFFLFKDLIIDTFAKNSPEVIDFLAVVILITLFAVLNSILDSFCRSFLKVAVPAFFREVVLRLLSAVLILIYLIKWIDFNQMMWGLAGIYFLALLGMIVYMIQEKIFQLRFRFKAFPSGLLSDFMKFSLITLLATTGSMLIMKIDSLMVTAMIGLDANAIYTIAFSIAVVIEMPRRAISQVVMPIVSEHFEKGEISKIDKLYKEVAVHQLLLCSFIFFAIWMNIDSLYHYVPNNAVYEMGKWVVLWIGLGKLTDVLFSINSEIIVFSKHYVFNITATLIMSIAVIVLNMLLIPIFGINGAAMASFMAMIIFNLVKFLYIRQRLQLNPFSIDILKILGLSGLLWIMHYFSAGLMPNGFWSIVVNILLLTAMYVGGIFLLDIAKPNRDRLMKKIKEVRS
ncbi:oligosaccharide flippase family protein [Belliella kenyensis]|uniref:Oligosaccharide flippase family protein n=1 Tax=Belliella kenyensis TaxID=1472724 RepID=A0ABV8EEU0_9BACT|nr:oligosaccharide flippase family protein [Belliella kenyensis]MCH7401901.1 oligosaccharide flippase family protein [Belliella kenyensis]MDN3604401.1 oligosaccharide flippase family protein [Belliella kenyensis]